MLGGIWGCILFELKEYTPSPPKKNSGRDFDFPPRPSLKRPKERPAGLSFGNLSGVVGEASAGASLRAYGRRWDGGTKDQSGVPAVLHESLPYEGRGWGRPGSSGTGPGVVIPRRPAGPTRESVPCPTGDVQEGTEASSWFPPPAPERSWIIFPGDTRSGKKSFHHATCERGPSRWDGPLSRQSGV